MTAPSNEPAASSVAEAVPSEDRFLAHRTRGVVGSILTVWILLMLAYLSFRHFERWDWTSEARYTLSGESLRVLAELDQDVEIYLFVPEGQHDLEDFEELVANYQAASPRITVRRISPDRQAGEFRLLAQRFQLNQGSVNGSTIADVAAVVVAGQRHWKVDYEDLRAPDMSSFDDEDGPKIDVRAEESFTGAIVEVTSGTPTRVCVLSGHGELGVANGPRSISGLRDRLDRMNVDVEQLAPRADIPDHCAALFVLGPETPVPAEDVRRVQEYLERGGNVFLALDPVLSQGERLLPTGFEAFARSHGILIGNDLVLELDPQRLGAGDPLNAFFVFDQAQHELLEPIIGLPIAMMQARSVRAVEGSGAQELLYTSDTSYAEQDLSGLRTLEPNGDDLRGPVPLAALVTVETTAAPRAAGEPTEPEVDEGAPNGGRLVVVGDADFMVPELMGRPEFANATFASAVTGWLTQRSALIAVPPRQANARPMSITEGDMSGIGFRVLFLLPAAMGFLGLSVWWSRRP
ncbi:MAG: GldG family protein [Sandaracinaceae bacterium]|nr:GldG family protein [Myxococcales bacterium]MCB9660907.1 GldG family protein [Sandaracinaceae bacterium]